MKILHILAYCLKKFVAPIQIPGYGMAMRRIFPPSFRRFGTGHSFRDSVPSRGFTLIELLSVMGIIALLASLVVPAFVGTGKSREIGLAATTVSNMLSAARTEAITQRTVTRLAIVESWPGDSDANFRKVSVWRKDINTAGWQQVSRWEELPTAIAFEPSSPAYIPGGIPANYLLAGTSNSFTTVVNGQTVVMKYVEFLPTGAAKMPQAFGPEIWMTLVHGDVSGGTMVHLSATSGGAPMNWAKISANTLTGRLKISQP